MQRSLVRNRSVWISAIAASVVCGLTLDAQHGDPQSAVNGAFKQFQTVKEGKNADHIPALAKVNPDLQRAWRQSARAPVKK